MNKQAQTKIVKELCDGIKEEIVKQIKAGKVPENWDGIELRWLVAERAKWGTMFTDKRRKSRKSEFDKIMYVNNL